MKPNSGTLEIEFLPTKRKGAGHKLMAGMSMKEKWLGQKIYCLPFSGLKCHFAR